MKLLRIPPNPNYPLPPDYAELSARGQRKARLNATRQWLIRDLTDQERAHAYIEALDFFDDYYLRANPEVDFDPMFYDDDPLPTPFIHKRVMRQWAQNKLSIAIAPRGSAKSFLTRKSILLEMLARPMFSVLYATSTGDNAKMTGQAIKDQLSHNERINDDFGVACPEGRLIPKRGEATFGTMHMQLMNGSWLRCLSAESRQRGGRPRLYVLDDPEYDPKASTSMQLIRDYMEDLLFKIVLPMVMRPRCGARWMATFVSRRHYAWHAMAVDDRGRAKDARFNRWSRMLIDAEYTDEIGRLRSCWPEMWPATRAERDDMAAADPRFKDCVSLEEVKETIGLANYLAEYRGRPGEGEDIFFPNLDEEKHGYVLRDPDQYLDHEPYRSNTRIRYYTSTASPLKGEAEQRVLIDKPLSTFVRESRLFMTVDTSYTATRHSDFKVACLMAITPENDLIVLDLWSEQCQQPRLVQECLKMASKWRCRSIHVEAVKEGITVYNDLQNVVTTKSLETLDGVDFLPKIAKFNPGMAEKVAKIASLQRRFEYGKLKLNLRERNRGPWKRLCEQIEGFNPDAPDGGLAHDDELDSIAMSMFVLKGRMRRFFEPVEEEKTPIELLKEGELTDKTGLPVALGIDWRSVSVHDFLEVMSGLDGAKVNAGSTKA